MFDENKVFGDKELRFLEDEVLEAEKERDELLKQLKSHPLYETHFDKFKNGIITMKYVKCGKEGCKCQYPAFRHGPYFYFQYKENGKIKQMYLPRSKELPLIRDMINLNQDYKKACSNVNKKKKKLSNYIKMAGVNAK